MLILGGRRRTERPRMSDLIILTNEEAQSRAYYLEPIDMESNGG